MSARGEAFIKAKKREVPILFTAQAISNAEQQLKKTITDAMNELAAGHVSFTDTASLLRAGMEAARLAGHYGGKPISTQDAFALIDEVGIVPVIQALSTTLVEVFTSDLEQQASEGDDPN
jgi:hypothetical protein